MRDSLYNLMVAPVAVLVRAPILSTALVLGFISKKLMVFGESVPGMRSTSRKRRTPCP